MLDSKHLARAALCAAMVAAAPLAVAADVFLEEIPIVLTASRMAQSPLDAPVAVTVIDREMIRASGFTEIHDLLRLVPGFLVADWPEGAPVVARHGLGDDRDRRIKVMVDGVTVNQPLWGSTAWPDLPLRVDDIERVEVVRGPNGAAYGVDAFDGVVNIITRSPATERGVTLITRFGKKGFADVGFRANGLSEAGLDWRLSASRRQSDNYLPRVDDRADPNSGERQPSGVEYATHAVVNFHAIKQLNLRDELGLQVALTDGVAERGSNSSTLWDQQPRDEETRSRFVVLSWRRAFDADSEFSLHASHHSERFRAAWLVPSVPAETVGKDSDGRRDELLVQYINRLSPAWQFMVGAGLREESVRSQRYFDTRSTLSGTSLQAFGNLSWRATERLKFDLGGTFEDHHYSGDSFSPRLAANFALDRESALRLAAGVSYRSPTFFEARANELVRVGNIVRWVGTRNTASLEPERVRHVELGYVGQFRSLGLGIDVRAFHERYTDFLDSKSCTIDFDAGCASPAGYAPYSPPLTRPSSPKSFRYVNSAAFSRHGAELSVNWRKPGWGRVVLSQAFTDIDADDAVSDRDFALSAPGSVTSVLLIKELPDRWQASVGYYRHGDMYWLNPGDPEPILNRFDLRLARSFGPVGSDNAFAIVAQSVNGRYPEFYKRKYRHEPQLFASLRLSW